MRFELERRRANWWWPQPSYRSLAAAWLVAITYYALGWWMGSLYS